MKLKNLFPVLVEKCSFSCNRSTRLFLSVVMIAMFTAPSTALAQSNGQAVATVQSLGQNPVEYTDLEAAFAAAQNNDEIKLLADCALAADDTHTGKLALGDGSKETDVVLDLNGHTISGTADELITITTNARLRILDSGTGGGIVTTGAKGILNVGVLDMGGGSVIGATSGIYSQGAANISGGTVSGGSYALYIEQGVANISGGTFVATGTDGIGIESESAIGFYFLGLPTFDCTVADISLAKDLQIEFAPGSFDVPAKKIRVKVDNEAPYTFTSNYEIVTDADGNQIAPEDVFVSVDYGEGLIGSRYDSNSMHYEAAIAGLTKVTFPAGTSTYFDQRALALYGTNDNLKFYGIKGLSGSTVQLAEFKSKKFGENSTVIVSNTSGAPITAEMVVAFEGPMASSFSNVAATDLDVQEFPPIFLDGTEEALTEIFVPEDYEVFGFSDNSFVLLGSDATAAANSGWLVAEKSKLPEGVSRLSILWPDGTTTGYYLEASWISLADGPFVYDGTAKEPAVTVTDNGTDVTDSFEWTYKNNVAAHDATGNDAPTVTVTAKATSTSYTGSVSKTFTITPKKVTISGVKAKDKIYDGTTSAVIDAESAIIDGKVEGDVLTVNAQSVIAVFADAEAGKDKPVTVSGFTLAGDQAGNYTLSAQPTSVTGTIVPKPVTVESGLTVSSTTLNEITGYSVDATNVKIVGAENNEKLSIMGVIARLQNGSTMICDLDYTEATIVIGVDKANNYVLAQQGNQATAEITASTETVENEDGSTIETATTRVKNADGSITETTQETVTGDDGSVTEKETTIYADASIAVKQTTTDSEGYQSGIEMSVSADGSIAVKQTTADAGGSETVETMSASRANDDGSTTHTEKVTETTKDADGKVTDTKTTTTESTATSTEHADGSVTDKEMVKTTETGADGSELVTGESIRETTTHADGSSVENVSETPDLGDTYVLDDAGGPIPDPEGAEGDNYKEIVDDVSGFIQDDTGVNDDDADDENQVSVLLGREADAGNVWLNTNEETDAEGEVIKQDASLTVKHTGSAGGSGEASSDSNPSAQIAIGAGALTSGSNSRKQSDSGKFGRLSWNYSGRTLTITGKGTMKRTKKWLKYKTKIINVIINDGVTNIASKAFSSHTGLSKVYIANSVTHIGSNAFQKCKILTSVNITSSSKLRKIGKGAFSGLSKLSTINLPSSVTHIGENAFNKCNKKTCVYVNVPNGKVLNVKIKGVSKPKVIKPNYKGKANITSCLFEKLSMRNTSRALTLHVVDAVDDDDTGDDPDDSGDDGDDSGDDGDDSGSGSDDSGDDDPTQIDLGFDNGVYTFNVDIQGHGNVSVPSSANVGDLVTITVIPDNGYHLAKLHVEDGGSLNEDPTPTGEPNQYTFQIPSYFGEIPNTFIIIHAIFEADGGGGTVSGGTGGGGSVNADGANKAATTVTMNYQTKKATDGGVVTGDVYGVKCKVTVANNSVSKIMIGGTVDKIIGGGTRGATAEDDEIEIVSGQEYKILRDGYIVLNFYTPDADITVNSIVFRRPGDANNDGYVNAVDLVEMINAKNGHASERFNLTNADIDRDGQITQNDIDAVVKLIMEQTDEK